MNVKRSDHSASLLLRETKYFVRIKAQKQDSARILKRILSAVSGEPDISVICDKNNLSDRGCEGPPDWIIEIVSPSTQSTDYGVKLFKYRTAGVREYWIINPSKKVVHVFDFENEKKTGVYAFDDEIYASVFSGFSVRISELLI